MSHELPRQTPATAFLSPTLVIQEGVQSRSVALDETPVTLGRASDNDIVLSPPFVSHYHARIEPAGPGHVLLDRNSTNGLLYQGQPVTRLELSDGAVVRIGDAETGNVVTLTYYNPMLTAEHGVSHQSYTLDVDDPDITIGREGCEVVIDSPQVSRFHAQIDRQADGSRTIRDMESTNGTFVNGKRITRHLLKQGDIIQIGAFKLVYNITSLDRYDQQGALRIDAHQLARHIQIGQKTLHILHEMSLSIAPREFVAIVGGSGAGKSSLLKALNGYEKATSGHVLINGDDLYDQFVAYQTELGYVPQDDILHRTLPVATALRYTAQLRLPADTTAAEITRRLSDVLAQVDLREQHQRPIQRLSGGQRKRTSIAAEMLSRPSLFFLDEPTSGLDPGLEKKMMYTLRQIADSGRIVVLVTHATENIALCDQVAFLARGHLVFMGHRLRR
ncbi:MAG: FHA domain-containing protein [Chloroflexaceae bacterium]|nr:FHA domain-containing protein [Chloroflexaceae bacterium]